ncbi:hypothetical protein BAU15_10600 [Enterococcus sp. JM4C]|uniref:DUF624 domain-containing protein n=1 Tax=Candidatus Enterococcus huntleyi TaxID=1857217 RepID=UPI00137A9FE1|nr:DUF624 domain-containing protein [Enterococcus sp. JM4C]KAF1296226.1 hypothetical protein BAU15_10600 [Enterococcus sp. JM4C]
MTQKLMKVINLIVILFLLNSFWFIGTLIGVGVVGLIPSTAALIHVLHLPHLFDEEYSYKEITVFFIKQYGQTLKKYTWQVLVVPIFVSTLYFDLVIIQQDSLMKALFQWPLIILISVICLAVINYFLLDDLFPKEKRMSKLKISFASLLVSPLQVVISFILFICFFVISLAYSWFIFFAIPSFIYVTSHLFLSAFKKKGLVNL